MRQKKKFLVIDVETANSLNDPLVYDVGFAICDNTGTIYKQESWVIWDVFKLERELMRTCYYHDKICNYYDRLKRGETRYITFLGLRKRIRNLMQREKITTVCAYNANFDIKALNTTLRYVTKSYCRWFFPYGTEINCIWNMACQVIYKQKKYVKWALTNNYFSPAGNIQTNAEVGKRYIDNDTTFVEQHMGLDDVIVECSIMALCYKKKKKMDKGINRLCWQIPTKSNKQMIIDYLDKQEIERGAIDNKFLKEI